MNNKNKKWATHYETIPHDNCLNSKHCDCDCNACVNERGGQLISKRNREWFVQAFGDKNNGIKKTSKKKGMSSKGKT